MDNVGGKEGGGIGRERRKEGGREQEEGGGQVHCANYPPFLVIYRN